MKTIDKKWQFSWSQFELYQQCPFKYYQQYLEKHWEPTNIFCLVGIVIHNLIERIYLEQNFDSQIWYKKWPLMLKEEYKGKSSSWKYKSVKQTDVDWQEGIGYTYLKNFFSLVNEYRLNKPAISIEETIKTTKFKQHSFKAKIDLVIEFKGGIALLDWKTGKPSKEVIKQLALYAAIYSVIRNQEIKWIVPVFLKTNELIKFPFDLKAKKGIKKYVDTIYNALITDKEWAPKKNLYCQYCSFKKTTCPLSKRRGK